MFVDRVTLQILAGKGGNGVIAWRREKFIPKGGPCGGNGGHGGAVILKATAQVSSLDWFRNQRILKAESGAAGGHNLRSGRRGRDLILEVPMGTLVKDASTGEVLCDLTEDGQRYIACKGGLGGRGNDSFKSPTNRAPNICTEGGAGETRQVELELKMIADIGLLGFPNAGKSTLIQQLARIRVKVAPYPFTTLHPNLGHLYFNDHSRVLIADIPGIIEGAHRNRGLGIEFLRHIERTQLIIYVLDASGIDGRTPLDDFRILQAELTAYHPEMLQRPHLVVLNKIDDEGAADNIAEFKREVNLRPQQLFEISALQGKGLVPLIDAMEALVQSRKERR